MNPNPLLSIVITSYTTERLKDIYELFDSIKEQIYQNIETIFIAERSKELHEKVKEYAQKIALENVRDIYSENKLGLGGARVIGTKESAGDIVAFVDDDVILFPEWAEEMVKTYQDDSIIGVSGAALPLWQDNNLDWLPKVFYWLVSCTEWTNWDEITEARSLWGMNMSLRKETLEKVGNFSPNLGYHQPMAEDLELSLRVKNSTGKKLLFNPKARVWHKVYSFRVSFKFAASRSHHIGISRRILRSTTLRKQAPFKLEMSVLKGIIRIYCFIPLEIFRNPRIAWKKFSITTTIILFAVIGYLFPGKNLNAAKDIEKAFIETENKAAI